MDSEEVKPDCLAVLGGHPLLISHPHSTPCFRAWALGVCLASSRVSCDPCAATASVCGRVLRPSVTRRGPGLEMPASALASSLLLIPVSLSGRFSVASALRF